ncbi:polysaccharide ABC transporter ATP-binding protein [Herminiimonas glaciei]|uniref:Polysaccharide ABC transporter ATP-binding protein n=1 Tax=Herminiimonas glaciei TaxID=523788 RepID=A0ABW2I7H6_9BURK
MSQDIAIEICDVAKTYPVFTHPWQAVRYLGALIRHGRLDEKHLQDGVHALSGVNLTVRRGERIGIVGRNGAGKSTLLKLLSADFPPTRGSMHVNGEIYCLLPGSVGFTLEQSTLENARQYLSYLPITEEEMEARIEDIRTFTELGEYFTQPVKNLSLGMRVRAEFAVATARMADIVIIDEVLGAGDIYWSEKIARRMEQLCAQGTTLVLVSHSLEQINRYCERAVWIEKGEVVLDDTAVEVTKRYEGFLEQLSWQTDDLDDKTVSIQQMAAGLGNRTLPDSGQTITRWPGRGDVEITGVWLNEKPSSKIQLSAEDPLSIRLHVKACKSGQFRLGYLFTFWSVYGKRVAVVENETDFIELAKDEQHAISLNLETLGLASGAYHITLTVMDTGASIGTTNETATRLDALYKSFSVEIAPNGGHPSPIYRFTLLSEPSQ